MIVHDVQQGTSQWLSLRAGIPTASQFHRIVTPGGAPSKSAEKYLYQCLAERCMRHPDIDAPKLWWADRGKELEPFAVQYYELIHGVETKPIGFITSDNGRRGASPDRDVPPNGLAEFKCLNGSDHMMFLLGSGSAYEDHKVQVQGQLLVCQEAGKEFVDVVAYHPELPHSEKRIFRDEPFIKKLDAALTAFSDVLEERWMECIKRGYIAQGD